jgi:hypothetical protein
MAAVPAQQFSEEKKPGFSKKPGFWDLRTSERALIRAEEKKTSIGVGASEKKVAPPQGKAAIHRRTPS